MIILETRLPTRGIQYLNQITCSSLVAVTLSALVSVRKEEVIKKARTPKLRLSI